MTEQIDDPRALWIAQARAAIDRATGIVVAARARYEAFAAIVQSADEHHLDCILDAARTGTPFEVGQRSSQRELRLAAEDARCELDIVRAAYDRLAADLAELQARYQDDPA